MGEEAVTISTVYVKPNAVEPTQDSTKVFTPRVETVTDRETAQQSTPRKPVRTEVRRAADRNIWSLLHVHECVGSYLSGFDSWPVIRGINKLPFSLIKAIFYFLFLFLRA